MREKLLHSLPLQKLTGACSFVHRNIVKSLLHSPFASTNVTVRGTSRSAASPWTKNLACPQVSIVRLHGDPEPFERLQSSHDFGEWRTLKAAFSTQISTAIGAAFCDDYLTVDLFGLLPTTLRGQCDVHRRKPNCGEQECIGPAPAAFSAVDLAFYDLFVIQAWDNGDEGKDKGNPIFIRGSENYDDRMLVHVPIRPPCTFPKLTGILAVTRSGIHLQLKALLGRFMPNCVGTF